MKGQQQAKFTLQGLSCANCAGKIENEVSKIVGITNASLDFATAGLSIEFDEQHSIHTIKEQVNAIIQEIEPEVQLISSANNLSHELLLETHLQKKLIRITLAIFFFGSTFFVQSNFSLKLSLYLISYLLAGGGVLKSAARNLISGKVFDENFLMTIATFGAFAIGEYPEGVAVMLFYEIGEFFQALAVSRSRRSIAELMDIRPDYAHRKQGTEIITVNPELVEIGEIIIVKPGEKIPLDGEIVAGRSLLDTSALTGESIPRPAKVGDQVLSGFINNNGLIEIKVTKTYQDSTVAKILQLVQEASSKKAATENFITKFASYYTPVVVIAAVLLAVIPPLLIADATFNTWLYRALVFLIISCPCALVVSIPLSFFSGIGSASRQGILVKGGNYLEALNELQGIAFDKTGTLTEGTFKVTKIQPEEISEHELLTLAAYAECYSNHPIAQSIIHAYGQEIDSSLVTGYQEIPGQGVQAIVNGQQILAGNSKLMDSNQVQYPAISDTGSIIYLAVDGKYVGYLLIADSIKASSQAAIQALKDLGITNLSLVTGDQQAVADYVAQELGINQIYANLLPQDKVQVVEDLLAKSTGKFAFVGDGINDAPVLARVDLGIAMGGLGADASIEAADIVLMGDDPAQLAKAINISRYTRKIVWQNITLALGVKILFLSLGASGAATLWEAVFADVGVTLLAVINSMRILRKDG